MTSHYTYLIEDPTRSTFYIGVRSCQCLPEHDDEYYGSSDIVKMLYKDGVPFVKTVIQTFETREEADKHEQELLAEFQAVKELNCFNLHSHAISWTSENTSRKIDHFVNLYSDHIKRPVNKTYNGVTPFDMKFLDRRVHTMQTVYSSGYHTDVFRNHPEFLYKYWSTTKTKTFHPGRTDKIRTIKLVKGQKEISYYETDAHLVTGTIPEQIKELFTNHLVGKQVIPIIEYASVIAKETTNPDELDECIVVFKELQQHYGVSPNSKSWRDKVIQQAINNLEYISNQLKNPDTKTRDKIIKNSKKAKEFRIYTPETFANSAILNLLFKEDQ